MEQIFKIYSPYLLSEAGDLKPPFYILLHYYYTTTTTTISRLYTQTTNQPKWFKYTTDVRIHKHRVTSWQMLDICRVPVGDDHLETFESTVQP